MGLNMHPHQQCATMEGSGERILLLGQEREFPLFGPMVATLESPATIGPVVEVLLPPEGSQPVEQLMETLHVAPLSTFEVHTATLRQQKDNLGRRRAKLHEENTTLHAGMEVTRQEFVAMHADMMLQERALWQHKMLRQGNERLHLENVTLRRKKETLLQEMEMLQLATAAAVATAVTNAVTNATTANTNTNANTITATTAINATSSTPMTKKKKSQFSWLKKIP
ncbi:unnamed protein product [Lampetra planeri]